MIDPLPRFCCACSEAGSTKHSFGTQSLPTVGMYSDIVTAEVGGAQLAFFSLLSLIKLISGHNLDPCIEESRGDKDCEYGIALIMRTLKKLIAGIRINFDGHESQYKSI